VITASYVHSFTGPLADAAGADMAVWTFAVLLAELCIPASEIRWVYDDEPETELIELWVRLDHDHDDLGDGHLEMGIRPSSYDRLAVSLYIQFVPAATPACEDPVPVDYTVAEVANPRAVAIYATGRRHPSEFPHDRSGLLATAQSVGRNLARRLVEHYKFRA
jgi:hypothetical protein